MAFFLDTGRRGPLERFTSNRPRQAGSQGWLVWALTLLRQRRKWAADRRALRGMNSHLRRDIGVSHESLRAELRRSFWDDPEVRRVRPGWPFGRSARIKAAPQRVEPETCAERA